MATAMAAKSAADFIFEWEGKDRTGKLVRGELRAGGEAAVSASMRRQGIMVTKVKKRRLSGGKSIGARDIAIKAAQTGHMVFSTLHTNDAPSTLTRLMNMGVAPFNIASSVILITAQRLARRLCTCKQPVEISPDLLLKAGFKEHELDGSWKPYGPVGCERCNGGGYKGRVGIYQIMPISPAIEAIILAHGNSMEIAAKSEEEGVKSLRQSGLVKVRNGLTSLEEVLGCTNE